MEYISSDLRRITENQALLGAIAMSLWMLWGICLIASYTADGFAYLLPLMAIVIAAIPHIRIRLERRRSQLRAATYRRDIPRPLISSTALHQTENLIEAKPPEQPV